MRDHARSRPKPDVGGTVDDNQIKLLLAGIAVVGTLLSVVVGAVVSSVNARSMRRRAEYGEALKSVVAWAEMPFRVRRREGTAEDRELRERFHQLQEDLACHRGLIGSESKYVERSYARLVREVKAKCEQPSKDAWARTLTDEDAADLTGSDIDRDVAEFLQDVRRHLSPWPWRKFALAWHNRESA